jgi:hypothetical protein
VSPVQQPVPSVHDAPLPEHALHTCCAHVPLQQSENVVHVPPPPTQAPVPLPLPLPVPLPDPDPMGALQSPDASSTWRVDAQLTWLPAVTT